MAYADARNAGFRHSSWTWSSAGNLKTYLGKVRCLIEKLVGFEFLTADASAYPEKKGYDSLDARVTIELLDNAGAIDIANAATPDNLTLNFTEANGTSGAGTVVGKMAPGTVTHTQARRMGGFNLAQIFELDGTLTYTPTA